jgi:hypothetical protein
MAQIRQELLERVGSEVKGREEKRVPMLLETRAKIAAAAKVRHQRSQAG